MPSPTSSLATLRPDLGGSLMEYDLAMGRMGFIASRVLPVFEAGKQSGTFGRIPIEELLQTRDTKRAPGAGYSRGSFKFTTDNYATEEHGAEEPIDDREAKMYADYFSAELIAAERARDVVLRNAEMRAADLIFNATIWTGAALATNITNEWDDATNATPIVDVRGARDKVWDNSGLIANALVINWQVRNNLVNCDQIRDRVASSGAGSSTLQRNITDLQLAQALDLDMVITAGSPKNTADEGQAVGISNIWSSEYAMVCRVATSNDIREPCVGRTFHWGEDGSNIGGLVETYRDEGVRSDIVRCRHDVDEKRLYVESGHLLGNVTTI